jgi:hypothetical protein
MKSLLWLDFCRRIWLVPASFQNREPKPPEQIVRSVTTKIGNGFRYRNF